MRTSRFKYRTWFHKGISTLFFSLLLLPLFLFPQNVDNLRIEKVPEEGLTNDYVVCINQDSNGFMWFGTREGLFRYDGYSFKAFKNLPGDSTSLVNNVIITLYPEKNNLWVGSLGGLSCIDVNTRAVKNFTANKALQVYAILPKNDSIFWVGTTSGLFQFNKITRRWIRVPGLDKNVFVSSITDDHKNHLYITTHNGFYALTKSSGAWKHYHPDLPWYPKISKDWPIFYCKSLLDSAGNLWMTTWNAGLVRFNTQTETIKTWSHQTNDTHLPPYKVAIDILQDPAGHLWLANVQGGLTIFDPSKNKFTNYPIDWKSENKFSGAVETLFRDRAGAYWIGTASGIYKYDPYTIHLSKKILLLKKGKSFEQPYNSPDVILKDNEGALWLGTYDGLFIANEKTGILTDVNKAIGLPANSPVFTIIQDKTGAIWCNEKNLLVKIIKKSTGRSFSFHSEVFRSDEIKTNIVALLIDQSKQVFVGTHGDGIFKLDQVTKKFTSCHYEEKDSRSKINEIRSFCEIGKDSVLVVGENTGLILFHTNTGVYQHIQWPGVSRLGDINIILKNRNDVWIGTEYKGLWQTDTHLKKPLIINLNDGLPSLDIVSVAADKDGNIWSLTNAGIVEFNRLNKKISVFDKKDGVQSLEGFNSVIADKSGNVLVGGRGCIYDIDPVGILKNTRPPSVLITDLKVFDKDYDIPKGQTIYLNYDQNYFSFEYVCLNYTQSKLNRYAYKMDGLDKKWNDAGSRRYVSYANLDEGTYTFNVKASNNEGIWNNVPARLVIVISPPFWHTWWFYLASVFVVSAVVYSLYMYNINQLKIRLQMRDKIARDLHDDIGSTLSGINIFSKIALQKMSAHEAGGFELVEKISDRSQKTLDALSDIVWSINTRNDGMDNFLMKANEYLAILEAQGIGFDFSVDQDMEHMKFGMILRRELYLIFKEAVCNASKYANCSFINISLTHYKETCTLTVRDNGKGFNMDAVSSGNGIYNMRQRAQKMNGDLDIKSKVNEGTTVTLNFRITRFR
jgi:ligand-binding sensor domain-containing protein/two-component sensor histidine kinase